MSALLSRDELVASYDTLSGVERRRPAQHSFEDRVSAASRAGFAGLGLWIGDYDALVASRPPEQLREIVDRCDVRIVELGSLSHWDRPGPQRDSERRVEQRLFDAAAVFGAARINASSSAAAGDPLALEEIASGFAGLCDRAAEHGLRVGVEAIPISRISNPTVAAEIVALADRTNGGMLLDSYHFFRGDADFDALERIPPELIEGVHLNDAYLQPRGGSRDEDAFGYRLVPGDGELALARWLRLLDSMGVDTWLSIECMSVELRELPVDEVALRVAQGTRDVLAAARGG